MAVRKVNSTNKFNEETIMNYCDSIYSICKIGGRWKMMILCELKSGKLRFGELKKCIPHITERMLTLQLRELEKDLLVKRTVYAEVPPRVEYQLSEIAVKLIPIWDMLDVWGAEHRFLISQKEAEL
ncbi:helix-turn-helix domain-containing protein [Flavobacterium sp. NKUCC04_CG]|uniref:winged helix-turn-helix transcriptional regulator n=1 Tax=Flavobacterium sp. NKUCC04_CG TaxID=2842121 RepID=UPI001C5BC2B8|nr:winged helix-turn-helix transcriptional regulator [Flavobacterium sp. NKUCC04_CG]MBW3518562.1 winged helix-turn-helix transcriptional regulator [Flavobacterium sp. NKUCC04_CG]